MLKKMLHLALFVHFDKIIKGKPEDFPFEEKEVIIDKETYEKLRKLKGKRRIGGNAGNAAQTLSKFGIKCILSCPLRPKELMRKLGKNIYIYEKNKIKKARNCWRNDEVIEHIVFEWKGKRMIFTYDPVAKNFVLDNFFWENVREYLFLSGFHIVPIERKNLEKTKMIRDIIEDRKIIVWLELGEPLENMEKHLKILIDVCEYIGMNEKEAKYFQKYIEGKKFLVHSDRFWITNIKIEKEDLIKINKMVNIRGVGRGIVNIKKIEENDVLKVYIEKKKVKRKVGLGDSLSSLFFYFVSKK